MRNCQMIKVGAVLKFFVAFLTLKVILQVYEIGYINKLSKNLRCPKHFKSHDKTRRIRNNGKNVTDSPALERGINKSSMFEGVAKENESNIISSIKYDFLYFLSDVSFKLRFIPIK